MYSEAFEKCLINSNFSIKEKNGWMNGRKTQPAFFGVKHRPLMGGESKGLPNSSPIGVY